MENDRIIELRDAAGRPMRFEFLDLIPYQGEEYVVLYPVGGSEEVMILRLEESDNPNEENYAAVLDERILQAVFEIFKERLKSSSHFADEASVQPVVQERTFPTGGRICNKWITFWLCFFLGVFGVHRFYEGKIVSGFLYLFTLGFFSVGVIIDIVIILFLKPRYYEA